MKLYFAPGACSLSPHIVMREAGVNLDLEQVNNQEKKTKSGVDYWTINAKGQVPVLEFDNGERLTEGPVIVQWIADQNPASGLVPPAGKVERYRVQEWLNFITSELHKTFGPIFRPTTPDAYKAISKENLGKRFDWLDKQLAGKQYLMGDKFTVADAYLYTVLRWTTRIEMDLAKWPNLKAYVERVGARPKVQEALKAEGLIKITRRQTAGSLAGGPGPPPPPCAALRSLPSACPRPRSRIRACRRRRWRPLPMACRS
jgi:glutathione S-transferase